LASNTTNSQAVPGKVSLASETAGHKESVMSDVLNMKDYRKKIPKESSDAIRDGLIPIEFAIGINNTEQCLDKMSTCGVSSIHVRSVNDDPSALVYLIGVGDAILLNKKILAGEEVSEEEIERRIDLIQMMENMNFVGMDSFWESFSSQNEEVL
jgi:hypothetical protein